MTTKCRNIWPNWYAAPLSTRTNQWCARSKKRWTAAISLQCVPSFSKPTRPASWHAGCSPSGSARNRGEKKSLKNGKKADAPRKSPPIHRGFIHLMILVLTQQKRSDERLVGKECVSTCRVRL